MKQDVPNFVPNRLEEALCLKHSTKTALAKKIGLKAASITRYIKGDQAPSVDSFAKICEALELPRKFFLTPNSAGRFDNLVKQWRSVLSARPADRRRGEVILGWIIEFHQRFKKDFDLPTFEAPDLGLPEHFGDIDDEMIEQAALGLREHWGLGKGPIRNLVRTAERAGIVVGRFNLGVGQLDAVSTMLDAQHPYILLNSFKQSGCRSRYDLAHEIGHLILHRGVQREDFEGKENREMYRKIEGQAFRFGAALLIPGDRYGNDLWAPTYQALIDVKEKWKISIQALIRRGLNLGYITENQYNWLNVAVSKKGARQVEPLDDVIRPEDLRLFEQCLRRYREDQGTESVIDLLNELPFPEKVIEEISGLPVGHFEQLRNDDDNILEIDFRK